MNDARPPATPVSSGPQAMTSGALREARLAEQRRWFRCFPEGPLEFLAAVRFVWILGLFVVPVVSGFLRVYAALALALLLSMDAALAAWWLAQISLDRDVWTERRTWNPREARRRALALTLGVLAAHGLFFLVAITFGRLPFDWVRVHPGAVNALRTVLLVLYVAVVPVTIAVGRSAGWRTGLVCLLPIPFLHWLAVRRLARCVAADLAADVTARTGRQDPFSSGAILTAEALWVLLVPVLAANLWGAFLWTRPSWQAICSGVVIAVAGVADVAAVESVQQAYLRYLHCTRPAKH